jgi:hypothetical protein
MQEIIENLRDLIESFYDPNDKSVLLNRSAETLVGVKSDIGMMIEVMPDNVAFGIHPHVVLTKSGKKFFAEIDVECNNLPSWQELREKRLFQISGEGEFIRSLPQTDEKQAVKILCAIGYIKTKKENVNE